jgi:hypothetical protein
MNTTEAPEKLYVNVDEFAHRGDGIFVAGDLRMFVADVEYLKATSAAHWVKCSEGLPEEEGSYLVVTIPGYWNPKRQTAWYWFDKKDGFDTTNSPKISHWLSNVPSIPTEEK